MLLCNNPDCKHTWKQTIHISIVVFYAKRWTIILKKTVGNPHETVIKIQW